MATMVSEGFEDEEWDAEFVDELIQVEEQALLSRSIQVEEQAPLFSSRQGGERAPLSRSPKHHSSHSPPPELSQRPRDAPAVFGVPHSSVTSTSRVVEQNQQHNDNAEIPRLKRVRDAQAVSATIHSSVSRTFLFHEQNQQRNDKEGITRSKQVHDAPGVAGASHSYVKSTSLIHESNHQHNDKEEKEEKKKERDKKEEQSKFVSSTSEAKEEELCHRNSKKVHHGIGILDSSTLPEYQTDNSLKELLKHRVKISSKEVGIQTDIVDESDNSSSKTDALVADHHQNKLLDIWDSSSGQNFGKDLVLKLFSTCEVDLQVLFGHLNLSFPSKAKLNCPRKSDEPLTNLLQSADAAKISHLYFVLTKMSNEMVRFKDLLEALVDLCRLNDESVLYCSLCILRVVLKHAFSMKRKSMTRDNIVVIGHLSEHTMLDKCGCKSSDNKSPSYAPTKRLLEEDNLQGNWSNARTNLSTAGTALAVSDFNWSQLFEMMCKITTRNLEEHIRLEAVSIMNIIVISCNAYSEREKFTSELVFQSILQLLKKDAGICVQKEAVKLLYQLLNCPKIAAAFCSGYQGGEDAVQEEDDTTMSSTFCAIMEDLVKCIACRGNSANELKLRRSATKLLAFLASLGRTGFAILLNHSIPDGNNVLACILQSLMSELDFDSIDTAPPFDAFKERTLLFRESLILLNRVVSHPQYSVPILQALTSSRNMTTEAVEIAKRLSQKRSCLCQDDAAIKQIRESEIPDLARVFRRRVFSFLGDGVS